MNTTPSPAIEAVEQIVVALDKGPTPGPWTAHFEEAYFVRGPDLGRLAMAQNLKGLHGLGGRRSGNESAANIKLIAACNPENIRAVLALLAAKQEELDKMREALKGIAEMTDPDGEDNYRGDDREGCLDAVFAEASAALSPSQGAQHG